MKPVRLLIPLVAACLLLVSARDSRSAVQGQVPDVAPPRVQAQPNGPLAQKFILYHPRFYKEYGDRGLSSTLYVQNPQSFPPMTVVLEFYECDSGALMLIPAPWTIPPRATRVAGPGDFPDLPPGCYGLFMASDMDLTYASVVEDAWSGGSAIDRLATHRGFTEDESRSSLRFGLFLKGGVNSTVHIWNVSSYAAGTVTASAYSESGTPIDLALSPCTVGPYAQCTYSASELTKLSTPFTGTLVIQSTGGSFVGIMALNGTSGDVNEYRTPLEADAGGACLPRVFKNVNEGGVVRSTAIFVANSSAGLANVGLVLYGSDGKPVEKASQDFDLAASGSAYLELTEMDDPPSGTYSVCASGDRPLAMEELTREDSPPAFPASSGTHGVTKFDELGSLAVTHLTRSDSAYTAFSIQNTGGAEADVDLKYYDVAGTLVYTDTVSLQPRGWARFDQSTQSELANGYMGSPIISSNQPIVSLVDQYVSPTRIYLPFVLR